MKLDIILMSYNQEQYIAQAVESILMQRVNDDVHVRVIVSDDCSKDKTLEIIKSYEDKSSFPFVYLSAEKNLGISENYRRAIAAIEAEYVAILEGDDYWTDVKRLQKHIDYLSTHTTCVMTKNFYSIFRHDTHETLIETTPKRYVYLRDIINHRDLSNLSAFVIRVEVLRMMPDKVYKYGELQAREAFDWYMQLYILQFGYGYVFDDVMSAYRLNTGENVSRSKLTLQQQIDIAYLCSQQSLDLIGPSFKDECKRIYTSEIAMCQLIKRDRLVTSASEYISPWFAKLLFIGFPKIGLLFRQFIRAWIPNKLYRMIRKK